MSCSCDKKNDDTICCPKFDPRPWENKEFIWENKLFIKDHTRAFFHIPLGIKKMMIRNMGLIKQQDAMPPENEFILLADEKSSWGADYYFHVTKEIPEANNQKISGTFLSKVFEGPYSKIGTWAKGMASYVADQNKNLEKIYFYYTTCPKCAKKYGKNYVVLLAKVK